ncbi:MAG TPA: DUF58 domain-containing protein [Terriglobales bacterium]|nr:DUF58 domain-containing protein [Terriglobales bacterium]
MINRWWALLLAAAALAGAWLAEPLLTLAGVLGLLVGGAELLWTRHCLTGVEYERHLDATRAAWGDDVWLTVRVTNRKLLPLTWLQVEDQVPTRLTIERAAITQGRRESLAYLSGLFSMLPYEQVVRRYRVRCRQRGLFEFGPSRVVSGDLLARTSRSRADEKLDRLIVYPKVLDLVVAPPRSRRMVGRLAADRLIVTDPSRTVGVRRYQAGDPLRHVEWRASARSRELLVRVFEPTTDLALALFIDFLVPGFGTGNLYPDQLEFAISVTASLARWALDRRYRVGLVGNGTGQGADGVRVPVGDGPEQLRRILEALALATPFAWQRTPISRLLASDAPGMPYETSVAVVTAKLDEDVLAAAADVARRRPVTVLHVRPPGSPEVRVAGLDVVPVPYEPGWHELERLPLAA